MRWLWPLAALALGLVVLIVLEEQHKKRLRDLLPRPADVPRALMNLYGEYVAGQLNPALLEALRVRSLPGLSVRLINLAVCLEVAGGRYREALLWRSLCATAELKGDAELLLRINEAEAMANLGQVAESLAWLGGPGKSRLVVTGAACHRAWCLAMLGRSDDAKAALSGTRGISLGLGFWAEWHLASAAVARCSGEWDKADHHLERMKLLALRASTKRNVHFARGLLLAARGEHREALVHFEKGAKAKYRGQGGEGLLAWGDSLSALGHHQEARAAWGLCVERDPQSAAAGLARARAALVGSGNSESGL